MNTYSKKQIKYKIISVISLLAFLGIWYLCTAVLELAPKYSLPDPVTVPKTFITKMSSKVPDGATLPQHILESTKIAFTGYLLGVVIGVPLGIAMGWFDWIDKIVRPVFDFIKPIPPHRADLCDDFSAGHRNHLQGMDHLLFNRHSMYYKFLFRYQADKPDTSVGFPDFRRNPMAAVVYRGHSLSTSHDLRGTSGGHGRVLDGPCGSGSASPEPLATSRISSAWTS